MDPAFGNYRRFALTPSSFNQGDLDRFLHQHRALLIRFIRNWLQDSTRSSVVFHLKTDINVDRNKSETVEYHTILKTIESDLKYIFTPDDIEQAVDESIRSLNDAVEDYIKNTEFQFRRVLEIALNVTVF